MADSHAAYLISKDIKLSYNFSTHNLDINLPTNQSASNYQLVYKHRFNNQLITEGVQGSLTFQQSSESAQVFIGTYSYNAPHPHQLDHGTVFITPENLKRDFLIFNRQLWYSDEGVFALGENLVPNQWYLLPNESGAQIKFTQLPSGNHYFSFQPVSFSPNQANQLRALTNHGYELKTDMTNGSFRFDLRLPLPQGINSLSQLDLTFFEDLNHLDQLDRYSNLSLDNGYLLVHNLNHMTIFVMTQPQPVKQDCTQVMISTQAGDYCFNTIQVAINAALPYDVIKVKPGNYHESLTINKPLTIQATGGYLQANLISPSNTAITIQSDEVVVDGFNIKIDSHNSTDKYGVVINDSSQVSLQNNRFQDLTSDHRVYGLVVNLLNRDINNLKVTNNIFENFHGNQAAAAIVLGLASSSSTHKINSLLIQDNYITQIDSSLSGAYGVLINHPTQSCLIKHNQINHLTGSWSYALGLEDDTPNIKILDNIFKNLTATDPLFTSTAIFIQDNPSAGADFQIHNNYFSMMDFGLINNVGLISSRLDATQNWWGHDTGPHDLTADGLTTPDVNNGSGVGVWGLVDYGNWLGFQDTEIPIVNQIKLYTSANGVDYQLNDLVRSGDYVRVEVSATDNTFLDRINFQVKDKQTHASLASQTNVYTPLNSGLYQFDFQIPTDGHYINTNNPINQTYHQLQLISQVYDFQGNSSTASGYFSFDETPPTTNFSQPLDNFATNQPISILGISTDNIGVSKTDLYFQFDRQSDWAKIISLNNSSQSSNFDFNYTWLPTQDGIYNLKAESVDLINNYEHTAYVSHLIFDQTKPEVPQNVKVSHITDTTAVLTWEPANDNLGIDHYTVEWNLDGTSLTYNQTVDANTFQVTLDRLTPGLWHARVIALDLVGNNIAGSQDFIVSSSATRSKSVSTSSNFSTISPLQPQVLSLKTNQTKLLSTNHPLRVTSPSLSTQTQRLGEVKGLKISTCSSFKQALSWLLIIFQLMILIVSLVLKNKSFKHYLLTILTTMLIWISLWQLSRYHFVCLLNFRNFFAYINNMIH